MKRRSALLLTCGALVLLAAFAANPVFAGQEAYTRYNIHAFQNKRDLKASYANWTDPPNGHVLIPMNTPITTESSRSGFIIHTRDGRTVYFDYDPRNMNNLSVVDYIRRITSPTPVSMDGFSTIDRDGIKQGKALVGMSKNGVMAALGYPAAHRTPSTDSNEWTYWRSRFTTLVVVFDAQGKVVTIRQ